MPNAWNRTLALALFALLACGCASVVKNGDAIENLSVEVAQSSEGGLPAKIATLRGKSKDSATWILKYEIEYRAKDVRLRIAKTLKRTGLADPYYLSFILPNDAQRLFLGDSLIWEAGK